MGNVLLPAWLSGITAGRALLACAVVAAVAYLLGCFNGAVIVSKYILKNDIRGHGSGNAGLTNFYRVFGGGLTFAVIFTDVLKAVLAVLFGRWVFSMVMVLPAASVFGTYFAGTACLLGHMFPIMFGFRGGKGILSGGAVVLMADWRVALVVWGGFLILFVLTRWVSLGSIWAGAAFPFATWFALRSVPCTELAVICGVLVVWKHRQNIGRLLRGEESRFSFHKKKGANQ